MKGILRVLINFWWGLIALCLMFAGLSVGYLANLFYKAVDYAERKEIETSKDA